jgi:hypothetical protein
MRTSRRESPLDLYNLALGAILIASPWLFHMTRESARIETWGAGALLVAISVAALLAFSLWEEWIALAVGLWMMISPWALGFMHTSGMKVNIGIGAVVVFLSGLELFLVYDRTHESAPS